MPSVLSRTQTIDTCCNHAVFNTRPKCALLCTIVVCLFMRWCLLFMKTSIICIQLASFTESCFFQMNYGGLCNDISCLIKRDVIFIDELATMNWLLLFFPWYLLPVVCYEQVNQALNCMEATKAIASVAPGLALCAPSYFSCKLSDFSIEVLFAKWKWPCPLKVEIPDLLNVFRPLTCHFCVIFMVVWGTGKLGATEVSCLMMPWSWHWCPIKENTLPCPSLG